MNFRPFPPDSVAVNKTVHGQKMNLIVDFCNNLKENVILFCTTSCASQRGLPNHLLLLLNCQKPDGKNNKNLHP